MKKVFLSMMMVAAMAVSFVSCKEKAEEVTEPAVEETVVEEPVVEETATEEATEEVATEEAAQ